MSAIKNNKNMNVSYASFAPSDSRTVALRDFIPLISQLDAWVRRVQSSAINAQKHLEAGHPAEDVLDSIKHLESECDECREILDCAIADT